MAPTSGVLMMMSGRRINCFCLSMSVLLSVNLSLVTITCSDHRGVYKTFLSLQIAIPFYILKKTLFFVFATSESQFFSLVKDFSLYDSSDYFTVKRTIFLVDVLYSSPLCLKIYWYCYEKLGFDLTKMVFSQEAFIFSIKT